jgi:hypothetical protein
MILTAKSDSPLDGINQSVFMTEKLCVCCEISVTFLHVTLRLNSAMRSVGETGKKANLIYFLTSDD